MSAPEANTAPSKLIGKMISQNIAPEKLKLNLGCGYQKIPGWTNVDFEVTESPDIVVDLGDDPWPWPNDSVDEAMAHHILEHLTTDEFFHFMKELYRVCKPDAPISLALPHPRHNVFLNDPTHKNAVTPDTIAMLCQTNFRAMIENRGGRLTPFFRYLAVDFDMVGSLNCVLDDRITEAMRESDEWRLMEVSENNVVIEWRFLIKAVKPFIDKGEPIPFANVPKAKRPSPVKQIK